MSFPKAFKLVKKELGATYTMPNVKQIDYYCNGIRVAVLTYSKEEGYDWNTAPKTRIGRLEIEEKGINELIVSTGLSHDEVVKCEKTLKKHLEQSTTYEKFQNGVKYLITQKDIEGLLKPIYKYLLDKVYGK